MQLVPTFTSTIRRTLLVKLVRNHVKFASIKRTAVSVKAEHIYINDRVLPLVLSVLMRWLLKAFAMIAQQAVNLAQARHFALVASIIITIMVLLDFASAAIKFA